MFLSPENIFSKYCCIIYYHLFLFSKNDKMMINNKYEILLYNKMNRLKVVYIFSNLTCYNE